MTERRSGAVGAGTTGRSRRLWVYVEDEARWIRPLTLAARKLGLTILAVDPAAASPGPWEGYRGRLLGLVSERLRAERIGWTSVRGAILDIYYPAAPGMPARALARHGQFVPGGIFLARELSPVLPGGAPVVFYSSKAHEEMAPRALHRLLDAPGRYYLLKLRGGADAAARWLATLDARIAPPSPTGPGRTGRGPPSPEPPPRG